MRQVAAMREGRGDRTRTALVHAALELFDRKGAEQTSIDEITHAANVAKGTFYVHFQRKEDVLLELAAQVIESLDHHALPEGAADALHALGDRLAVLMADMPREVTGRMVREIIGHREDWIRVLGNRHKVGDCIQPIVEAAQASGQMRTDQTPARLAQGLVILWLDSIIGWAERPVERPLERDLAKATSLFLNGARG
ncbi:MAG: TetR/AcrR family transcriptional regulator [Egibacteraceae bacterium]